MNPPNSASAPCTPTTRQGSTATQGRRQTLGAEASCVGRCTQTQSACALWLPQERGSGLCTVRLFRELSPRPAWGRSLEEIRAARRQGARRRPPAQPPWRGLSLLQPSSVSGKMQFLPITCFISYSVVCFRVFGEALQNTTIEVEFDHIKLRK